MGSIRPMGLGNVLRILTRLELWLAEPRGNLLMHYSGFLMLSETRQLDSSP